MKSFLTLSMAVLALILAGCSSTTPISTPTEETSLPSEDASVDSPAQWREPFVDEQGAVTVEITPLNLDDSGKTFDFQVSLNTHSVDLSIDLAPLATLTTDTGKTVQAVRWDAPLGGHHVEGTLSFPTETYGNSFLTGVSQITLKLVNVDAPERIFIWER